MRSTRLNLCRARRFVATSPSSARRFFCFLAIRRLQVHPASRCLDPADADVDRIPEPNLATGPLSHLCRLLFVQVEALAAQAAGRQEALVDITEDAAERPEEAGPDDSPDLAFEHGVGPGIEELAPQEEGGADIVGIALEPCRLPLALGALERSLACLAAGRGRLPPPPDSEEGAGRPEGRVAPGRGGGGGIRRGSQSCGGGGAGA